MDLRQIGEPFEKKFIQFGQNDIQKIADKFHAWQSDKEQYSDEAEYCYSATKEEIIEKGYSLVPSKYIALDDEEDLDYDSEIKELTRDIKQLLDEEDKTRKKLVEFLEEIDRGYNH